MAQIEPTSFCKNCNDWDKILKKCKIDMFCSIYRRKLKSEIAELRFKKDASNGTN